MHKTKNSTKSIFDAMGVEIEEFKELVKIFVESKKDTFSEIFEDIIVRLKTKEFGELNDDVKTPTHYEKTLFMAGCFMQTVKMEIQEKEHIHKLINMLHEGFGFNLDKSEDKDLK